MVMSERMMVRYSAAILVLSMATMIVGCGKKVPSYKDRIGTIDPATAPVDPVDKPPPPSPER